jgi:aminoglycoside phosphotransferase (APT) family kinase protein
MIAQPPTSFDWFGDGVDGVPAGPYPILGHGLWGPTLDLGDGTLLKLVQRQAGIGDGRDIHANEARVLSLLDGRRLGDVSVPRLTAQGGFPAQSKAAAAGYAAWLRLTRVVGRPIDEHWLADRSEAERERFAVSFAAAAASLRRIATQMTADQCAILDDRVGALLRALPSASTPVDDRRLGARLLDAVEAIPDARRNGFVHGDLHLQNLLVDDSGRICGIIDFGEAGRGFAEVDLAYLHWLPSIEAKVLQIYGEAAGPIDERAYHLAGAVYALTAAVLTERMGDAVEAAAERRRLFECLEKMGWSGSA